jgi:aryl-alcohol dehydrogenase-like predicted oxidoreductase
MDMKANNQISRMTLGTAQLGLEYGIANIEGKPDEDKAFRIIDSALENGVNCLDTAAAYGDSEKVLGNYFRNSGKNREDIFIVTKFKVGNIKLSDVETVMMKSVENSLKSLNSAYLDILLIHDAQEFSVYGRNMTKVFEKLLSGGIINKAGASCYGFREIEAMLENEIFQAFQVPANILDMRISNSEDEKKLNNKLVFVRSVFLQGLFFLNPENLKGNLKETAKYLLLIKDIAEEMNISLSQLLVTYVRSLHFADSLIIGADNPKQVEENLKLLEVEPFPLHIMDSIRERVKGAPDWVFSPFLWDKQHD